MAILLHCGQRQHSGLQSGGSSGRCGSTAGRRDLEHDAVDLPVKLHATFADGRVRHVRPGAVTGERRVRTPDLPDRAPPATGIWITRS